MWSGIKAAAPESVWELSKQMEHKAQSAQREDYQVTLFYFFLFPLNTHTHTHLDSHSRLLSPVLRSRSNIHTMSSPVGIFF